MTSPKSPHEPEPEAALETLSRGQADRVSAFGAELVGVWAATGTIQHQNFKRQSVPHWPFLILETKHQWNKSRKRLLPVQASWCTTKRLAGGCLFSSRLGGQQLYRGGRPDHTPGCICTKQRSETNLPAFKPGACFSSLPIYALCGSSPRPPGTGHFCLH